MSSILLTFPHFIAPITTTRTVKKTCHVLSITVEVSCHSKGEILHSDGTKVPKWPNIHSSLFVQLFQNSSSRACDFSGCSNSFSGRRSIRRYIKFMFTTIITIISGFYLDGNPSYVIRLDTVCATFHAHSHTQM